MFSIRDYIIGLKDLLVSSPDKVLISDPDEKILYVNDTILKSFGIQKKNKEKLYLNDIFNANLKKQLGFNSQNENTTLGKADFNLKGKKEKFSFMTFNVWKKDLSIGKVLVIADSKNERQELKNNLFQHSIMNVMNHRVDSIWFMTNVQNGKSTYTSDSVKNVLGWTPDHFNIGGWFFFFSIVHPDDIAHYFRSHAEWVVLKNKLGLLYDHVEYTNSFRIKDSNGDFIALEANSNVLERDEAGKTKLVFGSFRLAESLTGEEKNLQNESYGIKIIDGRTYVELDYLKKLRDQREDSGVKNIFSELSTREQQILELIVEENSSAEISKNLNISIHTVHLHRKQLLKKLGAKNLAGLIRIFYSNR